MQLLTPPGCECVECKSVCLAVQLLNLRSVSSTAIDSPGMRVCGVQVGVSRSARIVALDGWEPERMNRTCRNEEKEYSSQWCEEQGQPVVALCVLLSFGTPPCWLLSCFVLRSALSAGVLLSFGTPPCWLFFLVLFCAPRFLLILFCLPCFHPTHRHLGSLPESHRLHPPPAHTDITIVIYYVISSITYIFKEFEDFKEFKLFKLL